MSHKTTGKLDPVEKEQELERFILFHLMHSDDALAMVKRINITENRFSSFANREQFRAIMLIQREKEWHRVCDALGGRQPPDEVERRLEHFLSFGHVVTLPGMTKLLRKREK